MSGSPNVEELIRATSLANIITLKRPNVRLLDPSLSNNYVALVRNIEALLITSQDAGKLMLPNLSAFANETVAVFSDYAGEGSGDYYTYSFLICAWNLQDFFHQEMAIIRARYGLGTKEIAFKDFRMGQMRAALPHYLRELNNKLPGLVFTLVIDKRITSVIHENKKDGPKSISRTLIETGFGSWKPPAAEKLMRIVHASAFFVALLSKDGQKVFWMTDNDDICPDTDAHKRLLHVFNQVLTLYADGKKSFPRVGGARPFSVRDVKTTDLLSVADVTASSMEHYLTRLRRSTDGNVLVKEGSDEVLRWLAFDGIALKKFNMIIKYDDRGEIQIGNLVFNAIKYPEGTVAVPIYM
ncbi:hypothetical protein [Methylobacterium sp. 391_Methyba4]|uniref:hypothetical protein n=1 Tax=Methylobacterium sp. 391_Methyba4 TaxID=3038924 RepID=UPI00241EBF8C|nr:hypothetical protein [Methylobacterium sp. 391_Methyba4]WFS07663.1 hypothetical protein P9K36_30680 [Methylobacterium sp. 391_Methyba4]